MLQTFQVGDELNILNEAYETQKYLRFLLSLLRVWIIVPMVQRMTIDNTLECVTHRENPSVSITLAMRIIAVGILTFVGIPRLS